MTKQILFTFGKNDTSSKLNCMKATDQRYSIGQTHTTFHLFAFVDIVEVDYMCRLYELFQRYSTLHEACWKSVRLELHFPYRP